MAHRMPVTVRYVFAKGGNEQHPSAIPVNNSYLYGTRLRATVSDLSWGDAQLSASPS
jgi:hypothetical protein